MKANDWRSIGFPGLPEQIPEYEFLNELAENVAEDLEHDAKNRIAIEIGSWHGRSTALLAQWFHVIAFDTFSYDDFFKPVSRGMADAWRVFWTNMNARNLAGEITVICGTSDSLSIIPCSLKAGLAFIDGDHSKEAMMRDVRNCLPHLVHGGLVICHDWKRYGDGDDPWHGVKEGVNAILTDWGSYGLDMFRFRPGICALRKTK